MLIVRLLVVATFMQDGALVTETWIDEITTPAVCAEMMRLAIPKRPDGAGVSVTCAAGLLPEGGDHG